MNEFKGEAIMRFVVPIPIGFCLAQTVIQGTTGHPHKCVALGIATFVFVATQGWLIFRHLARQREIIRRIRARGYTTLRLGGPS